MTDGPEEPQGGPAPGWTPPGAGDGRLQLAFGRGVEAQRKQRGLSRAAFADVLGCHPSYVGGLERGDHNLSLLTVARIARKLEVDPIGLLTF
jgi:ribosome-binding protein aMBF1 (putative translation factor)